MRKNRWLSSLYVWLVMLFLYAPIAVLIVFSFNDSKSRNTWTGFTLRWYEELFHDRVIIQSFVVMLVVAIASSVVATLLGTLAAIGLNKMNKKLKSVVMTFTYLPMINPEIITGVALMLLFIYLKMEFGMQTLIISHITFNVPYVILNVLPKLRQMDQNTYDAALDLGCNPFTAFTKVVIPEIMPGIVSGFLMALTYSMDDFVISYFVSGASIQTLPVAIYSMTRRRVSPKINALSTIMFAVVLLVLLVYNILSSRKAKTANRSMIRAQKEELQDVKRTSFPPERPAFVGGAAVRPLHQRLCAGTKRLRHGLLLPAAGQGRHHQRLQLGRIYLQRRRRLAGRQCRI